MTAQGDSEYQFRYKLKCLSDQLTSSDLESLKTLCSRDVNTEDITSGIMLWKGLQDCGKLNINHLMLLLTSIGKQHLFENIFNSTGNGVGPHNNALNSQQGGNNGSIKTQEGTSVQEASNHSGRIRRVYDIYVEGHIIYIHTHIL